MRLPLGTVVELRAPAYRVFGEDYDYTFRKLRERGFKSLLVDGEPFSLGEKATIDETAEHVLDLVVDRYTLRKDSYIHLTKSIEAAMLALDEEIMVGVEAVGGALPDDSFCDFACPRHHHALCQMQPLHFSFNVPAGACQTCMGVGLSYTAEPRFLVVSPGKSIRQGALKNVLCNP